MIEGLLFAAMVIGYLVLGVLVGSIAFFVCYGLTVFVLDTWEKHWPRQ